MDDQLLIQPTSFLAHPQPEYREQFSIMGEALVVQSNHPGLIDLARQAFSGFGEPVYRAGAPLEISLFVRSGSSQEAAVSMERDRRPDYQVHRHLFSIQLSADSFAVADLASGVAFGYVDASYLCRPEYVRYALIEALGLSMLGLSRGYFVVHAACVVKNKLSVILQGRAGIGKSTLTYACARRGYRVLADDSVQVKVGRGEVHLWGMARKVHLLPGTAGFFPELKGHGTRLMLNGETKLELDLEELWAGSTLTNAAPGILVLLSRETDKPVYFERVSALQSGQGLEVIWSWPQGWDEAMDAGAQLLLQGGIYRLNLNGHPDQCVDILDALVDSLTRQW